MVLNRSDTVLVNPTWSADSLVENSVQDMDTSKSNFVELDTVGTNLTLERYSKSE